MRTARFDRHHFGPLDLGAIAIGGVAGATLRWLITERDAIEEAGWFAYAPNTATTLEVPDPAMPWTTLFVNVLGCLLLGLILRLRSNPGSQTSGSQTTGSAGATGGASSWGNPRLLLAAGTGFCGSLTTFSTFAVELAQRLRGNAFPRGHLTAGTNVTGFESVGSAKILVREGATTGGQAIAYLLLSLALGAVAFAVGRMTGSKLT